MKVSQVGLIMCLLCFSSFWTGICRGRWYEYCTYMRDFVCVPLLSSSLCSNQSLHALERASEQKYQVRKTAKKLQWLKISLYFGPASALKTCIEASSPLYTLPCLLLCFNYPSLYSQLSNKRKEETRENLKATNRFLLVDLNIESPVSEVLRDYKGLSSPPGNLQIP